MQPEIKREPKREPPRARRGSPDPDPLPDGEPGTLAQIVDVLVPAFRRLLMFATGAGLVFGAGFAALFLAARPEPSWLLAVAGSAVCSMAAILGLSVLAQELLHGSVSFERLAKGSRIKATSGLAIFFGLLYLFKFSDHFRAVPSIIKDGKSQSSLLDAIDPFAMISLLGIG